MPSLEYRHKPRALFTSNVCPISTQTTIFISVAGTSTVTVSTQVGTRATRIPGDVGTDDGGSPGGGPGDDNPTSGRGYVTLHIFIQIQQLTLK